jgi:hypothetical protein
MYNREKRLQSVFNSANRTLLALNFLVDDLNDNRWNLFLAKGDNTDTGLTEVNLSVTKELN